VRTKTRSEATSIVATRSPTRSEATRIVVAPRRFAPRIIGSISDEYCYALSLRSALRVLLVILLRSLHNWVARIIVSRAFAPHSSISFDKSAWLNCPHFFALLVKGSRINP